MSSVFQAALESWSIPPVSSLALCLLAAVYLQGWWRLRSAGVPFVPQWRVISFMLGLFLLWLALASPLDTFSGFVLTAHMLQHMLLMMAAPPLILLGAPLVPLVGGLPAIVARKVAAPVLNWSFSKKVGYRLSNPVCALLLMGVVMFAWHIPKLYELALGSSGWHELEHACFFLAALIFWWPVVQPWPSHPRSPRWTMVPYLLVGDLQNTALSAILVFSDRTLYPSYAVMPRLFGSALEDQAAAGAIMWVVGSLAFVLPAVTIAVRCLSMTVSQPKTVRRASRRPLPGSSLSHVLQIPLLGRLPQSRLWRRAAQATSFLLLFGVIGLCFAALASSDAQDDDSQVLRFNSQSGPFTLAVFAQPGNLSPGPNRFSIMVQDRNTQDVQLDVTVDLTAIAETDDQIPATTARASRAKGENKLLQTAELDLPNEGNWKLHIAVRHNSRVAEFLLPLQVVRDQATHEHLHLWLYIVFVAFGAILLFAYAQRHKEPESPQAEHPVSSL